MAKSFVLGNGRLTVGLDKYGQVYDLYFPYVGLENHMNGPYVNKVGIWVNDRFSWIDDGSWEITYLNFHHNSVASQIDLVNNELGLKLTFKDEVYNEKDIFLREVIIDNISKEHKKVKIFFNQQLEIYESYRGDTAYFDPNSHSIIHYKGRRVFLINAHREDGIPFNEFSIGLLGIEGKQGTYVDAEDGKLEMNPIEHGLTDSVIAVPAEIPIGGRQKIEYWICVAKQLNEVISLNDYVKHKSPEYLRRTTRDYWRVWLSKRKFDFYDLSIEHQRLFLSSLKMIRLNTDNTGAIVASIDSDLLKNGRDYYSYVWPRDAAFTASALSRVGYDDIVKKVFEFFLDTITPDGYFLHKYRPDRSIGSSWHPWVYKGSAELPIQIDETALVVCAIWEDFKYSRDVEFLERIYNSLVLKATEFLVSKIDKETGLVAPSYDLWEERFGTSTFTSCTVYGALMAASQFTQIFGKNDKSEEYFTLAVKVRNSILTELYDEEKNLFLKMILNKKYDDSAEILKMKVLDSSSLYGLFKFNVLDVHDPMLKDFQEKIQTALGCHTEIGGLARYENDNYFKVSDSYIGNPWIITTLWMTQLKIAQAKTEEGVKACKEDLDWVLSHSTDSGVLPEQLNPFTGEHLSATPLTWSHAEYVQTVIDYIEKLEEINRKALKLNTNL